MASAAESKNRPVHPGEVLQKDFMEPLGLSSNALAIALRVTPARVNEIVRERRGISPETALRLARYFDNSPQFWLNLQQDYDLASAQHSVAQMIELEVLPRSVTLARSVALAA